MTDTTSSDSFQPGGSAFMLKVFYLFAALAAASFLISMAGRYFGDRLAMGGHSQNTAQHEIVIGNNVLAIPENMIRYQRQRSGGIKSRVDLYMLWPQMTGYSDASREAFNYAGTDTDLLFVSIEEQIMSRDMSGRFDPIYSRLIAQPGTRGRAGLTVYEFTEKSGYVGESLVTGEKADGSLFVARCPAKTSPYSSCERDVLVGDRLVMSYRFAQSKLDQWRAIEAGVLASVKRLLKTTGD